MPMTNSIDDMTELVTARFLAASATSDEFFAAYDRALASFGAAIAGDAIERCTQSGTPQGDAVGNYVAAAVVAERKAGRLPEMDRWFAKLGLTPIAGGGPTPPKPPLRVIEGGLKRDEREPTG